MKRPQNFKCNNYFLSKIQETRGSNSTNLTLLMLGFAKKMFEKLLILAFSSLLEIILTFHPLCYGPGVIQEHSNILAKV